MAGWVSIHGDDHTAAYAAWSEGHRRVPQDAQLARQAAKRECWDQPPPAADAACLVGLVGAGAGGGDCEAFAVPEGREEPALRLFDPATQRRRAVFRSRRPVLTADECAAVLQHAESLAAARGRWGTVRHSSVPTTDVAVEDIPALRPWLRALLATRLQPMLAACFPRLADGSSCTEAGGAVGGRLRVHDAFIVRYAADDNSLSLPEHRDTSSMSFTIALNGGCFEGGGTWFGALGDDGRGRVIDADVGHAIAFMGPLRHAGYPITSGTRTILVLFMYVHGFDYGRFLGKCACGPGDAEDEGDDGPRPSGMEQGGFVVYQQTVDLMSTLKAQTR